MTILSEHTSEPLALCKIDFDSDEYLAKVDVAGDNFWSGLIKSFGTISRTATIPTSSNSFRTSDVTVTCFNTPLYPSTTPYFSENYDPKTLLNKEVSFYVGTTDLEFKNFKLIYKGTIQGFEYTGDTFKIRVKDAVEPYLEAKDYAKIIDSSDWANSSEAAVGKRMPIIYGDMSDATCPCVGLLVDTTAGSGKGKYLFAGHASKAIDTVKLRDSDGALTSLTGGGTDYTAYTAEVFDGDYVTTIIFAAGYSGTPSEFDVIADIQGVEDDGDGTGTLISNPVEQLEHFLTTWLSLPTTLYNSNDFRTAENIADDRSYAGAGIITGKKKAKKVIQEMGLCLNGIVYSNNSGELSVNIFNMADLTASVLRRYTDQDEIFEKSFKIKPRLREVCNKVTVNYNYDAGLSTYKGQYLYEDSTSQTNLGKTYEKEINLPFVALTVMAQDIAQRYIKSNKYPPLELSFKAPLVALNNDLTDICEITHFAGLDGGGYDKHLFRIEKIQPSLDKLQVSIAATDVANLLVNVYILGDEDDIAATWGSATDADKYYGYLCDDTDGLFANDTDEGKRLY